MIEVGWEPSPTDERAPATRSASATADPGITPQAPAPGEPAEELLNDHYAAIQAWNEWAANQGRAASATA